MMTAECMLSKCTILLNVVLVYDLIFALFYLYRWSVNGGKSDSTFKIFGRFRRSVQEVYDFAGNVYTFFPKSKLFISVVLKLGSTEPQGFSEAVAGVRLRSE